MSQSNFRDEKDGYGVEREIPAPSASQLRVLPPGTSGTTHDHTTPHDPAPQPGRLSAGLKELGRLEKRDLYGL